MKQKRRRRQTLSKTQVYLLRKKDGSQKRIVVTTNLTVFI
jgi:hypothetical protein